jgi:hypothetical protein
MQNFHKQQLNSGNSALEIEVRLFLIFIAFPRLSYSTEASLKANIMCKL